MPNVTIRQAGAADALTAAALAARVYGAGVEELLAEYNISLKSGERAAFLAECGGDAVGLIDLALRHDYVNGCETTPVAFVEGVFVDEKFRRQGIAKQFIAAAEQWAKEQGCSELASDRLLENDLGEKFHLGCGFEETERVVYYRKTL